MSDYLQLVGIGALFAVFLAAIIGAVVSSVAALALEEWRWLMATASFILVAVFVGPLFVAVAP